MSAAGPAGASRALFFALTLPAPPAAARSSAPVSSLVAQSLVPRSLAPQSRNRGARFGSREGAPAGRLLSRSLRFRDVLRRGLRQVVGGQRAEILPSVCLVPGQA